MVETNRKARKEHCGERARDPRQNSDLLSPRQGSDQQLCINDSEEASKADADEPRGRTEPKDDRVGQKQFECVDVEHYRVEVTPVERLSHRGRQRLRQQHDIKEQQQHPGGGRHKPHPLVVSDVHR